MPGSDPVTAVANALTQAGVLAKPFIDEAFAQRYENEHKKRTSEFLEIIALPDGPARAGRLSDFVLRLLGSAGSPAGGVGRNISVPMDVLIALVAECSESVKKDSMMARLEFKKD